VSFTNLAQATSYRLARKNFIKPKKPALLKQALVKQTQYGAIVIREIQAEQEILFATLTIFFLGVKKLKIKCFYTCDIWNFFVWLRKVRYPNAMPMK
jgi:hypothetical protein